LIKERPVKFSFTPDTSGKFYRLIIEPPGRRIIANRIEIDTKKAQKEITREAQGLRQGKISYKTFVINNAKRFWNELEYWSWKNYFWGFAITGILPLFLMGLYFGRRKVFYDLSANRAFLKKVMKWGLIIGMTSFAIALGFQAWNYFNQVKYESYSFLTRHLMYAAWDFLGVMGMAMGYIAGLALLLDKAEWKKRLSFLAPVGRMGLTNYLLQAVIIFITMEPYGLSLNGKAGPAWRLLMALASFIFIFLLSRWWFKHFRIGPAEWIWRSLTYLKFQPMRLKLSDTQSEHSI